MAIKVIVELQAKPGRRASGQSAVPGVNGLMQPDVAITAPCPALVTQRAQADAARADGTVKGNWICGLS